MNEQQENLLKRWICQFHKLEKAHFSSATACRLLNYSLGIPLLIVTVIIASDTFGLLEQHSDTQYPKQGDNLGIEAVIVIACSLLAPILAALQTFLRFPERAEQHKNAANAFGELRKKTQSLIISSNIKDVRAKRPLRGNYSTREQTQIRIPLSRYLFSICSKAAN